jgi:predicted nucleic acid-binding protein
LDTGPIVALFDAKDQHHAWAVEAMQGLDVPLLTCEPVLTEAFYLLSKKHNGIELLVEFCGSGAVEAEIRLLEHVGEVGALMTKYRSVPMDLADACLVQLAGIHRGAAVITTDRDFLLYRTASRRQIPLIAPFVSGHH